MIDGDDIIFVSDYITRTPNLTLFNEYNCSYGWIKHKNR